jgi:hypothetical protein
MPSPATAADPCNNVQEPTEREPDAPDNLTEREPKSPMIASPGADDCKPQQVGDSRLIAPWGRVGPWVVADAIVEDIEDEVL